MLRARTSSVRVPLKIAITLAVLAGLGKTLVWFARRPRLLAGLLVATGLVVGGVYVYQRFRYGPAAITAGLIVVLVGWRIAHSGSFRRVVAWPFRSAWRRPLVYGMGWRAVMQTVSLGKKINDTWVFPRIVKVRSTATVDRVTVKLIPGQVLEDFAAQAHRLANNFDAVSCRVRAHRSKRKLVLWFLVADPLTEPVELLDVPDKPNLRGLSVAVREDSLTYRLRLLGTHLLIAGATGAGKGSVLWSIIRALGPMVRDRLVELWVIDPKGGMELTIGRRLFARFCYGDPATTGSGSDADDGRRRGYELALAEFLEAAVAAMQARQARLRGIERQHKPAPGDPAIVVIIDELASLTGYVVDREAKKRIESALALLLSQGRAVGVYVVAALQDPRKEVIPARTLIPARIAMRLAEAEDTDMVLGKQARERGAACHEVSEEAPGVAYVSIDGVKEPVRVRFAFVSDDEINTMCALYAPGTSVPDLRLVDDSVDDDPETDTDTEEAA